MKAFKFSLMLYTCENTDVCIMLNENIYGIHCKRVNMLYFCLLQQYFSFMKMMESR